MGERSPASPLDIDPTFSNDPPRASSPSPPHHHPFASVFGMENGLPCTTLQLEKKGGRGGNFPDLIVPESWRRILSLSGWEVFKGEKEKGKECCTCIHGGGIFFYAFFSKINLDLC
ncbi:hypothetical protein CDAR_616601 [Caerostris darwini]|uniref:Uncharacterized protein n=1 Tax=Caerostris darwini TaxID=1538125 RepID=A0AAV4VT43_9ARAC|nr:hypothetical protein CDAR_616601 [Caerostris darwini]